MTLPEALLSAYFVIGILFTTFAVISKKQEGGFMSSYPWAEEPILFAVAMLFWPITIAFLMFSKRDEGSPK